MIQMLQLVVIWYRCWRRQLSFFTFWLLWLLLVYCWEPFWQQCSLLLQVTEFGLMRVYCSSCIVLLRRVCWRICLTRFESMPATAFYTLRKGSVVIVVVCGATPWPNIINAYLLRDLTAVHGDLYFLVEAKFFTEQEVNVLNRRPPEGLL